MTSNQHGDVSTLIDGKRDHVYMYQPYICTKTTPVGFLGSWIYKYNFDGKNTMWVFGVAAIWMNVEFSEKVRERMIILL